MARRRSPDRTSHIAGREARPSERRYLRDLARESRTGLGAERIGWVQVNCALFQPRPGLPPYVPWQALREAIGAWREQGLFQRWFLMRKPPGLRLRFYGSNLEESFEPQLLRWLERAEFTNAIRSFRFARYEPERFLFGGPAGMVIAHDLFDRDSENVLRYETLSAADRASLPRELLSIAFLTDLASRLVEDRAELWDIWKRLEWVVGPAQSVNGSRDLAPARAAAELTPEFVNRLTPEMQDLLQKCDADCEHSALKLHTADVAGRLRIGVRAWLATAGIFHLNRFGSEPEASQRLIGDMVALLDPHGAPHG